MAGICKFINEILHEWPILFMDDYRAKEWLSEKSRAGSITKNRILHNSKRTDTRLKRSLAFDPLLSRKDTEYPAALFEDVYGYGDIKALFRRAISSDNQVHILLVGPPACAIVAIYGTFDEIEGLIIHYWKSDHQSRNN